MDVWSDVESKDDWKRVKATYLAWFRMLESVSRCDRCSRIERDSTQDNWERPNGGRGYVS
jgi:hypothetical protein